MQQELPQARPLIPMGFACSAACQEVLDTFAVIAEAPKRSVGVLCHFNGLEASDILAVQLLLKATGGPQIYRFRHCSRL